MEYHVQAMFLLSLLKLSIGKCTHQANKYAEELNYICVCHRIKSSNQSVEDGDEC